MLKSRKGNTSRRICGRGMGGRLLGGEACRRLGSTQDFDNRVRRYSDLRLIPKACVYFAPLPAEGRWAAKGWAGRSTIYDLIPSRPLLIFAKSTEDGNQKF